MPLHLHTQQDRRGIETNAKRSVATQTLQPLKVRMSTISALCSATMDSFRQTTERPGTARPYGNVRKTSPVSR